MIVVLSLIGLGIIVTLVASLLPKSGQAATQGAVNTVGQMQTEQDAGSVDNMRLTWIANPACASGVQCWQVHLLALNPTCSSASIQVGYSAKRDASSPDVLTYNVDGLSATQPLAEDFQSPDPSYHFAYISSASCS